MIHNIMYYFYATLTLVYFFVFGSIIAPTYKDEELYLQIVSIVLLIGMPVALSLWTKEKFFNKK
jgi:hypothetical protein